MHLGLPRIGAAAPTARLLGHAPLQVDDARLASTGPAQVGEPVRLRPQRDAAVGQHLYTVSSRLRGEADERRATPRERDLVGEERPKTRFNLQIVLRK